MSLTVPNLDNRTHQGLVRQALAMLPEAAPHWTEYNPSDPGVTLIEMLAWLTEMQIYRLNRLPETHYRKFLKLLGYRSRAAVPARVRLSLRPAPKSRAVRWSRFRLPASMARLVRHHGRWWNPVRLLPAGIKLIEGRTVYETLSPLFVSPIRLVRVLVMTKEKIREIPTHAEGRQDFPAFGDHARAGDCLILGFDRVPRAGRPLRLFFQMDDPPARGGHWPGKTHSAELEWAYADAANGWRRLKLDSDETHAFSRSGEVQWTPTESLGKQRLPKDDRQLLYLRIRVKRAGFDQSPRLRAIVPNTVTAVARDSCVVLNQAWVNGRPQTFAANYPLLVGRLIIQIRNRAGLWEDWTRVEPGMRSGPDDPHVALIRNHRRMSIRLSFPGRKPEPSPSRPNLRVIAHLPDALGSVREGNEYRPTPTLGREKDRALVLGYGTGFPHQRLPLGAAGVPRVRIQIQTGHAWRDWRRVDDFHASSPEDPHFVWDGQRSEIRFGDGIHGRIPERGSAIRVNALVVACASENVHDGAIWQMADRCGSARMAPILAVGPVLPGKPGETVVDVIRRLHRDLDTPERAVTAADYEWLALHTPGLRVARAHVLPAANGEADEKITLAVAPESRLRTPQPSARFLELVRQQLEPRRLVTCELAVVAPLYVPVAIKLQVEFSPQYDMGKLRLAIADALECFLHPLGGGPESKGWPFGRTVYRSEIHHQAAIIEGVVRVPEVSLSSPPQNGVKRYRGDLLLPPSGLAYTSVELLKLRMHSATGGD